MKQKRKKVAENDLLHNFLRRLVFLLGLSHLQAFRLTCPSSISIDFSTYELVINAPNQIEVVGQHHFYVNDLLVAPQLHAW